MAPRAKKLPASQLTVDRRVQRDHLDQAKLATMRADYNRDALGTIQVSDRGDGTLIILDGWHRHTIVTEIEGPDYSLACQVFTGLTLPAEAALFTHFNNQRPASKLDIFNVRTIQDDPAAVAISKVVGNHDWAIGIGNGMIRAVDTLEAIYNLGQKYDDGYGATLLGDTLSVITQAWGNQDKKAVDRAVLNAIALFLLTVQRDWVDPSKNRRIDLTRLARNLSTLPKGPAGWLASCKGIAEGARITLRKALTDQLRTIYNQSGPQKLPASLFNGN